MKRKMLLLIAALLCVLLSGALAENASLLKTQVPDTHVVTVECGENGGVWIGGKRYTGVVEVEVPRLGTLTLRADGDQGYKVNEIVVLPEGNASIRGDRVTLKDIYEDKTVIIAFRVRTPYQPTDAERLYDDVLGTGSGRGQLNIVYDEEWTPPHYELLPIRQGRTLFIQTGDELRMADETGEVHRKLLLKASQVERLIQDESLETLHFSNGSLTVSLDLRELLQGPIGWLLKESRLRGLDRVRLEEIPTEETLLRQVVLTQRDLAHTYIKVRTEPSETDPNAWQVQVFLRADDTDLDVTALLTTLRVSFPAPILTAEECDAKLLTGEVFYLLPLQEPDSAECYTLIYEEGSRTAEVYWTWHRPLAPYRQLSQEAVLDADGWYRPAMQAAE